MLFRQEIEVAVDRELDGDAEAAAEVSHVPFEGGLQTEVIEHARAQAEREITNRADHVVYELPALGDGTSHAVVAGSDFARSAAGASPRRSRKGSVGAKAR